MADWRLVCEHIRKYDGLACVNPPVWRITLPNEHIVALLACDDHLAETLDPDELSYTLSRLGDIL